MKHWVVKSESVVRYFIKPECASPELYDTFVRLIAENGALIVSQEMLEEYIAQEGSYEREG